MRDGRGRRFGRGRRSQLGRHHGQEFVEHGEPGLPGAQLLVVGALGLCALEDVGTASPHGSAGHIQIMTVVK